MSSWSQILHDLFPSCLEHLYVALRTRGTIWGDYPNLEIMDDFRRESCAQSIQDRQNVNDFLGDGTIHRT